MAFESMTDETILSLLSCSKHLGNPQARSKSQCGHEQVNYKVSARDGSGNEFEVYKRANLRPGMEDDFSCGISWLAPNGETMTLRRYNGSSHPHANHLEKNSLDHICHIHIATERYVKANRKAEGFAELSNRYCTLAGAFHCLITDCNITGIQTTPDDASQLKLFET